MGVKSNDYITIGGFTRVPAPDFVIMTGQDRELNSVWGIFSLDIEMNTQTRLFTTNDNNLWMNAGQPTVVARMYNENLKQWAYEIIVAFSYNTKSKWGNRISSINTKTNEMTTLYGGTFNRGMQDGTGNSAKFDSPQDLVSTSNGLIIFVTDVNNKRIRKIDRNDNIVTTLAGGASDNTANGIGTAAGFDILTSICISRDDTTLYVADRSRIRKIVISTQTVSTYAGAQENGHMNGMLANMRFGLRMFLSLGENNPFMYIADSHNNAIRQIDMNSGSGTTIAGSLNSQSGFVNTIGVDARFSNPSILISFSNDSYLFICEKDEKRQRQIFLKFSSGCLKCSEGKYSSTSNLINTCVNCMAGKYSTTIGATSSINCVECIVGKYALQNTCEYCEAGKYISVPTSACIDCAAGKYKNIQSEMDCTDCPRGEYFSPKGFGVPELPLLSTTILNSLSDFWIRGFCRVPETDILIFSTKYQSIVRIIKFDTMKLTTSEIFSFETNSRMDTIPLEPILLSYNDTRKTYSILISMFSKHQIWRIDVTPEKTLMYNFAGNEASGFVNGAAEDARFLSPTDIKMTKNRKSIFVVDSEDKLIRKIDMTSLQNTVSTFAGSTLHSQSIDGTGTTAGFTFIHTICITSNDFEIFVLDSRIIRKIVIATAQVSTFYTDINGKGILDGVNVPFVFGAEFQTFTLNIDDTMLYVSERNPNVLKSIDLVENVIKTIPSKITDSVSALIVTSNNSNLIIMDANGLWFEKSWNLHSINLKNNLGCKSCPANSESAQGSTTCFCNTGFYGLHTATCTKCAAGKYKSKKENVDCQACIANSNSEEESKNSIDCSCNLGFFMANGEICTQCAAGKYKSDMDSANCQNCIANSNSPAGSDKSSACLCNTGFSPRNANECIQELNVAQKKYSLRINMVIGGSTLNISTEIIDAIQEQTSASLFVPIYRISRLEFNANKGLTRRLLSVGGSFLIYSQSPHESSEIKSIITVETLNSILSVASSNTINVVSASVEDVVTEELETPRPITTPASNDFLSAEIILLIVFLVLIFVMCCIYFIMKHILVPKINSSSYNICCDECHYRI